MKQLFLLIILSVWLNNVLAQAPGPTRPFPEDYVKRVDIIHSDRLEYQYIDSLNEFQKLVGHVKLRQGNTLFFADSVVLNQKTNITEAFGNIHINDADSVHTYSQYLKYFGNTKLAQLRRDVKLTDGKGTLTTDSLDYDVGAHIGSFKKWGKVKNDKTVLVSEEGFYYADTRDVYFKKKVILIDPEYNLATDTLLYNTGTSVATFLAPTTIDDGVTKIYTREGFYNLKTGQGNFGRRSIIEDKTQTITGDQLAFEKKTGNFEGRGNVVYKDTAQGVVLIANHLFGNRNKKSVLATEKPVMILKQEADSIYVAADTLFSGLQKDLDSLQAVFKKQKDTVVIASNGIAFKDSVTTEKEKEKEIKPGPRMANDETAPAELPVKKIIPDKKEFDTDSIKTVANKPAPALKDTTRSTADSLLTRAQRDSLQAKTDTLRFMMGFHHVRIFSDSMQAVADSMFFSAVDSIFRLYQSPVVWSKENQVTGDTMYLYTKNRNPKRVYVFENGLAINRVEKENYNQLKGRIINGYFKEGNIDNINAKGNAESIYFAQDEDSSYIGVNRTSADVIDMYFANKELKRVVFRNQVKGKTVPMRESSQDFAKFPEFKWWDNRRPKNKFELFQ